MIQDRLQIVIEAQNRANKELASLNSQLKGVKKAVQKDMQEIKKSTNDLGGAFSNLGGMIAGAFTVGAVVSFGKELQSTVVQLDMLNRKADIVLGEFRGEVEAVADTVANSMGMSKNQFVGLATDISDLLIPIGFARDEAAKMSTDVLQLSGALAEWTGGQKTASEAAEAMRKALMGEREMLEAYGIKIMESHVQQRLLEKGMQDLTGDALEQAKAVATLELMFEKSTDAQTSFKNGSDTLVRSQAEAKAAIRETKEAIAAALTPALSEATFEIMNMIKETLSNKETQESLILTLKGVAEAVKFVMEGIINFIGAIDRLLDKTAEAVDFMLVKWYQFRDEIKAIAKTVKDVMGTMLFQKESAKSLANTITKQASSIFGGARAMGGPVASSRAYLVGENGPELFVPSSSGNIVPNTNLGGISINFGGVSINNGRDERRLQSMIEQTISNAIRNKNAGII